jgi:hypothetical protein
MSKHKRERPQGRRSDTVLPRYDLDELLAGISPDNRHDEVEIGPVVGEEFR